MTQVWQLRFTQMPAILLLEYYCNNTSLNPVAYYSRHNSNVERKYHSYELETLAVEMLLKFRVYLLGFNFKVVTDCNALKMASSKRDLIPRDARWWLQLQKSTLSPLNTALETECNTLMPLAETHVYLENRLKKTSC